MATPPRRKIIDVPTDASGWLKRWPLILGLVAVLIFIYTGMYSVPADSQAVVQRFGKYISTQGPGLRFKIPFGVDVVTVVASSRVQKLEFGFDNREPYTNIYQAPEDPEAEKDMVTGDLSAVEVEWVVQYVIDEPVVYLFHVRNPEDTLRDLSEATVREVVGDRAVDTVLTTGRQEIETEVSTRLRNVVKTLNLGLRIETIELKKVNPPEPVQSSFDSVNRAQQEREQLINQANGDYNKVIPKADGEVQQKVSAAEGYALQRVNEAQGNAARFTALLKEYEKAPEVTRQRLYLETMSEVLPTVERTIIIDENARNFLPLLMPPAAK